MLAIRDITRNRKVPRAEGVNRSTRDSLLLKPLPTR
jgi:hypothetical protein